MLIRTGLVLTVLTVVALGIWALGGWFESEDPDTTATGMFGFFAFILVRVGVPIVAFIWLGVFIASVLRKAWRLR